MEFSGITLKSWLGPDDDFEKIILSKFYERNIFLADVENFTSKPRVSRTPQSSLLAGPNEFFVHRIIVRILSFSLIPL